MRPPAQNSMESAQPQAKKRRTDRACDACRRKKTRCDGPWATNNICSNCDQAKKPCTYMEASKPRGPPKAYIAGLEDRVEELEALLAQIKPNTDFSEELGPPVVRDSWKNGGSRKHCSGSSSPVGSNTPPKRRSPTSSLPPPTASPLPPLLIPFRDFKGEDKITSPKTPSRTTHLMFKSRHGSKKPKFRAQSEQTTSSSSGASSGVPPTVPDTHSTASSFASTSDSEWSSTAEESDSNDSGDLFESSAAGRVRLGLKMNEIPSTVDNRILFHGRNSTAALVEVTRRFKYMHMQSMGMQVDTEGGGFVKSEDQTRDLRVKLEGPDNSRIAGARRPVFWKTPAWEAAYQALNVSSPLSAIPHILAQFPPPDLCRMLIKLYFLHSNTHFPLLHKPTFERQWEEKLYERNVWHASLCLMIFAVGSRWSDDERVLDDLGTRSKDKDKEIDKASTPGLGQGDTNAPSSRDWTRAGWKYFESGADIHRLARSIFTAASLFEVQCYTLMGMFLRGTQHSPTAWLTVAVGLRKAQDVGAHRKSVYQPYPNVDDELWRRAFWHLVVFDRIGGTLLGRSIGIGEEDFDLDLPTEVDDEYWSGDNAWKQPPGQPSLVSSFNHLIRLTQIIAFTSKTVYAIDKHKLFRNLIDNDWRVEVISQLNTAMDEWIARMPKHLRWSENMPTKFFSQSSMLYSTYHLTITLIYRPFIPTPPLLPQTTKKEHKESSPPLVSPPFPALATCVKAALASARILEAQFRRRSYGCMQIASFISSAFTCAGTLILALWDMKAQQKVLIKIKNAGVINLDQDLMDQRGDCSTRASTEDIKVDSVLLSLKQKMEKLYAEVNMLINALEWLEPRWENVTPLLAQLRESIPTEQDLQSDLEAGNLPDTLTIVKQQSFQDLRRQRQQAQQDKQTRRGSQVDSDMKASGLLDRDHSSDVPNPRYSADPMRPHPTPSEADRPGSNIDVGRFLQDHFLDLHTFTDDDFDPALDNPIQLPTLQFRMAPPAGHDHSATHSPTFERHPPHCRCAECLPPSHGLPLSRDTERLYHHYDPARPVHREPRLSVQGSNMTPNLAFQHPSAHFMSSAVRSSMSGYGDDPSSRRPSSDHSSVHHPHPDPPIPSRQQTRSSTMGGPLPRPISASLDGYSMHHMASRPMGSMQDGQRAPYDDHQELKLMYSNPMVPIPDRVEQTHTWATGTVQSYDSHGSYRDPRWEHATMPQTMPGGYTRPQPSPHSHYPDARFPQHHHNMHDISQQQHQSYPQYHHHKQQDYNPSHLGTMPPTFRP